MVDLRTFKTVPWILRRENNVHDNSRLEEVDPTSNAVSSDYSQYSEEIAGVEEIVPGPSAGPKSRLHSLVPSTQAPSLEKREIIFVVDKSRWKIPELLFNQPAEIQTAILSYLGRKDVLALRLSCWGFYSVTQVHQSVLVRNLVKHCWISGVPRHCSFRSPPPGKITFEWYYRLLHQGSVVINLCKSIADFIAVEIHQCRTPIQKDNFKAKHALLVAIMHPFVKHIRQFLEHYRAAMVDAIQKDVKHDCLDDEKLHQKIEQDVLKECTIECLVYTSSMFRVLRSVIARRLRPPLFAGKLEKQLRGWSKPPATEEDIVKLLVFGGLERVAVILRTKGYAARRKLLDDFLDSLEEHTPAARTQTFSLRPRKLFSTGSQSAQPQPAKPRITKINRSIKPLLHRDLILKIMPHLPKLNDFIVNIAEQILVHKGLSNPDKLLHARHVLIGAVQLNFEPGVLMIESSELSDGDGEMFQTPSGPIHFPYGITSPL